MHPHGLNEKVGICEDSEEMKWFESDDVIFGRLFPGLPRSCQRD